ncbi:hypothetical protein [Actinoplanes utahensis]|uniref:Histidine kinase n=1 Tax=Actinoplanes utahensis TaxID=1869 RepID=A0A0A6XBC1_ACTUT|nr:hypothetical protein [Actinoplanes utahensis]KHD77377.1 hypothetical protein MB27_11530 [Actinoplanes utahensis]GIF32870.1 hypothetical protein Aut01nite_58560 [Actinoplanes utahensis]
MFTPEVMTAGVALLGAVVSLTGLWLRLRFRLQAERERRHYLTAAATLPFGSRVQEQRGDGTRITLAVGQRDEP